MPQQFAVSLADAQNAFPNLQVTKLQGEGGQKFVFDAIHPSYGRIALKIIRSGSAQATERALRELQAPGQLLGPSFARLYDYGHVTIGSETVVYVFEEFLTGMSLRALLTQRGRLQ